MEFFKHSSGGLPLGSCEDLAFELNERASMQMLRKYTAPSFLALGLCLGACGGSEEKRASSADDVVREDQADEGASQVGVSSEIGGLNQEAVDRTFSKSLQDLQRCLDQGAEQLEFLGGDVSFSLKIGTDGHLSDAHLEESTLGDRDTELCMLQALAKRSWPKPVGGETGLARKSFSFDMPKDVRPPTDWSRDSVEETLDELSQDIDGCKDGGGAYTVTMYVGTDGSVMAAGVAHSEDARESAADCLVAALKGAKFPSPGSWPAKVSFSL